MTVRKLRYEGSYYFHETILPEMDYSINPYFGCEIGCKYCYTIYYLKVRGLEDKWGDYVEAKVYLPRILARNLNRFRKGSTIGIGTASDPYQPWEAELRLTRRILKILRRRKDLNLSIQTRYPLILRDMDIILDGPADIGTSIPSMDRRFMKIFEPRVPSPEARFKMLERFIDVGVETWVYVAPIIPYVNDSPKGFEEIVKNGVKIGVDTVYTDIFRSRIGVKQMFLKALERYSRNLAQLYRGLSRRDLFKRYEEVVKEYREIADSYGIKYIDAAPMMFKF